jgi:hypothetical protein
LSTRDTVGTETPASCAIVMIVTRVPSAVTPPPRNFRAEFPEVFHAAATRHSAGFTVTG